MVSEDEVIAAYRFILGREPETAQVVQAHVKAATLEDLRASFINSSEFQMALANTERPFPDFIQHAGLLCVEVQTDEETLARLLERVERCWTRLGQTEPHWSVLSTDEYRKEKFEGNAETFFASGEQDVARLVAWLERNGVNWSQFKSCLEFGCGTGRVTPWLAQRFGRVIACDISTSHIALAATHVRQQKADNVDFLHTPRLDILDAVPQVDVVFTVLVLQHNPPPIIYSILDRIFRHLNPGGVAFFQVPTYALDYSFEIQTYLLGSEGPDYEGHVIPQRFVFELAESNNCAVLEVESDRLTGDCRWISNTFLVKKRSN